MALSKTGRFLSKAEILGVGAFSPLSNSPWRLKDENLQKKLAKMSPQFSPELRSGGCEGQKVSQGPKPRSFKEMKK